MFETEPIPRDTEMCDVTDADLAANPATRGTRTFLTGECRGFAVWAGPSLDGQRLRKVCDRHRRFVQ